MQIKAFSSLFSNAFVLLQDISLHSEDLSGESGQGWTEFGKWIRRKTPELQLHAQLPFCGGKAD